ncbi:uncharacterized protein SCHCODRAFT_02585069 [Schizophyllum commune H4-8]|nr:uncharacterized protein SCHCODRAFT_02585069 [Schizophyllum commune H4-8]KAI5889117.1 hypothetical protein SCHCODRAFT_02585069 [Schizophyllum commune H4-8]
MIGNCRHNHVACTRRNTSPPSLLQTPHSFTSDPILGFSKGVTNYPGGSVNHTLREVQRRLQQQSRLLKLIRISLLPHIYLPAIEISALTTNLFEVQNDLEACVRAIDRLEATLADLRQHRSLLETTETHVKSICAPIRKLPPDILGEIAAYALPPRWFDDPSGKHVWTVMQVFHDWRAAALALTWPWTVIHLPRLRMDPWNTGISARDVPTDILSTYLQRSKQAPVVIKKLDTGNIHEEDGRNILLRHAYHVRALEALQDHGREDLVPCHLPLLQELIFRGPSTGRELDAPHLRVLDTVGAAPFLHISWGHMRAVKIQVPEIDDASILALSQCTNVEILSFSTGVRSYQPRLQIPHSFSFPTLHTLEIGGAAIKLCPLIVAPSLRHFTLNLAYDDELWEPGMSLYDVSLLNDLIRGCDTIALRNMHTHSAVHIRDVFLIPQKLRKVSFIQESGGGSLSMPYCMNSKFVQALACSHSDSTLVDLEEVEIINGAYLARWTDQDIDLVCDLFRTRAISSSTSGCPGLKRVHIRVLYDVAVEQLLKKIGPEAESILDVEQGDPVAPFQVAELLRT